jgi:hypothetical protein
MQTTVIGRRLNLLERRLMKSLTTVVIPFDERVFFSLLNCPQLSGRLPEVAQTLHAISGILVPDR